MTTASFAELLASAVTEPGILSKAYQQFHTYSIGNQLLAWAQCQARGVQPGPMATFPRWKELGRHVRRGEKALTLCMPVTVKRRPESEADDDQPAVLTRFIYRPHWFVLAQTEGQELAPILSPTWDADRALAALQVAEVPFDVMDGNVLGYARDRAIAVSPVNPLPHKTRFHELSHVLLGHTSDGTQNDDDRTPRNLCECEAEAVALVCCAALELPGVEEARGYIQSWWGQGNPIPERSAQRILKVADRDPQGRDGRGGAVMSPRDQHLAQAVEAIADALQTAGTAGWQTCHGSPRPGVRRRGPVPRDQPGLRRPPPHPVRSG